VRDALQGAFDRYGGEAIADEPYADWAEPLRAEVRSTMVAVARALAEHAEADGDHVTAVGAHRRILDLDRYDEAAHRGLIRVFDLLGAHGQARAAQEAYDTAMAELQATTA
jgi:DNA-binding SARP family transcriptional activator